MPVSHGARLLTVVAVRRGRSETVEPRVRIPRVVTVLALSIFALGTSEFVIVGLLPEMATDLGVSIPQTGYLVSAFAIGMTVGAPLTAVLTLRLPRRTTALAAMAAFIAGTVVAALSADYALLLVSRVLTAVATATFWVVASVVTVSVVGPHDRARALSVLLAGLTVASVAGVPLGTMVGQHLGWRAAFWAIAAVAVVGLVGVATTVRGGAAGAPSGGLAAELAVFRLPRLWLALATTVLYQSGAVGLLSYVAPLLTDVSGLDPGWVPAVLLGYGAGGVVGVVTGGRLADRYPWWTLFGALGAVVVVLALVAVFAPVPVVAVVMVVLLGVVAFAVAAPLNARVFGLAGAAPTLAGATNTAAGNLGNTIGPALGGAAIGAGFGYTAPAWLGVALAGAAIGVGLVSWRLDAPARNTGVSENAAA
jgi:DHA1 family chloramphenicol resistance protein-like MFS transporter